MSTVLTVEELDVSVRYGGRNQPILRDINLELRKGEVHGLVGESGAGKSMLGRVILDIMPSTATIDGGRIHFNGKNHCFFVVFVRVSACGNLNNQ